MYCASTELWADPSPTLTPKKFVHELLPTQGKGTFAQLLNSHRSLHEPLHEGYPSLCVLLHKVKLDVMSNIRNKAGVSNSPTPCALIIPFNLTRCSLLRYIDAPYAEYFHVVVVLRLWRVCFLVEGQPGCIFQTIAKRKAWASIIGIFRKHNAMSNHVVPSLVVWIQFSVNRDGFGALREKCLFDAPKTVGSVRRYRLGRLLFQVLLDGGVSRRVVFSTFALILFVTVTG